MTAPDISQFELADPAPAGQLVPAPAAARTAAGQSLSGLSAGRRPAAGVRRDARVRGGRAGGLPLRRRVRLGRFLVRDGSAAQPRVHRLPAVGVIVGAAAAVPDLRDGRTYAMRTRSAAAFARERLARLLVPLAFGLVVLVPPMFYIEGLGQPAFHQPSWRFWLSFVNVPALARGLLIRGSWTSGGVSFDPAHLRNSSRSGTFSCRITAAGRSRANPDAAPLGSVLDNVIERIAFLEIWVNSPGAGPLHTVQPGENLAEGGFRVPKRET